MTRSKKASASQPNTNGSKPRKKAVEVELSRGRVVTMHEPGLADLSLYLRAMPGLEMFWNSFQAMDSIRVGVIQPVPELPETVMLPLWELVRAMTGLAAEEMDGLSASDGMALMMGLTEFANVNFMARVRILNSPAGQPA